MSKSKIYYWVKLPVDFFEQPEVKYMINMESGTDYIFVYLKLVLMSANNEGRLYFKHLESRIEIELARQVGVPDEVMIRVIKILEAYGMLNREKEFIQLIHTVEMVGAETEDARRMRRVRQQKREKEGESVRQMFAECSTEKEIREKSKEKEMRDKSNEIKEVEKRVHQFYDTYCKSFPHAKKSELYYQIILEETIGKGISEDKILEGLRKAEKSDYLKGDNKEKFLPEFEWLIRYENMRRILSGHYDNSKDTMPKLYREIIDEIENYGLKKENE